MAVHLQTPAAWSWGDTDHVAHKWTRSLLSDAQMLRRQMGAITDALTSPLPSERQHGIEMLQCISAMLARRTQWEDQ